jgi:hypothetical protein
MVNLLLHNVQTSFFLLCLTHSFDTPFWSSINVPLHFLAGTCSKFNAFLCFNSLGPLLPRCCRQPPNHWLQIPTPSR